MPRKKKKAVNTLQQTVLDIFIANPYKSYNYKQLSAAMGISDRSSRELVKNIMKQLAADQHLVESRRGKYKLHSRMLKQHHAQKEITGVVDMKQTGKAYIISNEVEEDIFIAANNTFKALNGDEVKVRLFPKRHGRKSEGKIIEIIHRHREQFVGILDVSDRFAFLIPDDTNTPIDIYIPLSKLKGGKAGQKAIASITDWPDHSKNPFGEIVEILGTPGENEVEMKAILTDHGFPTHFPKHVEKEAAAIPSAIPPDEIKKRRDFRKVFTCTVDPIDAKDFDDALSLQKLPNGNYEVGVHIADVSYYVTPGSSLDEEAFNRGTSIYLVDRVVPMLPEKLSNHVCSLRPHEDKLCYSAVFEMTPEAGVVNEWFGRTIIHSSRRYHYQEVQDIIEKNQGDFKDEILTLHRLSEKLRSKRFENGSIAFSSQEVKFVLDEKGKPVSAYIKEQKEANWMIEDFMLLANKKVAEKIGIRRGKQAVKPFVYRIHDKPNPEKLLKFSEFLKKLGYDLKTTSHKAITSSMNQLFKDVKGKGEENMIETIAVRTMAKAEYSIKNIGHYGLAFKYYTHFTSPIRRYPDLMVHRLLNGYLTDKISTVNPVELEKKCEHASIMEKKAQEAERASIKYKQAEYMLDKVGQEFDGLISGVSKWGIFVEIDDTKVEGMISMKDLEDDSYYLDENNYKIIGYNYGTEFKLGDPIRIKVKKIDLAKKQLDFFLVKL